MNKRLTALLLALVLLASVGMVSALAGEGATPVAGDTAAVETEEQAAETVESTENPVETSTPEVSEEPVIEVEEAAANMVMFTELPELMRKNSPSYKALVAQINYIEDAKDYVGELTRDLAIVSAQIQALNPSAEGYQASMRRLQAEQADLQSKLSRFASISAQDTTQMEAGCDQMIMGCETMYINLVNLKLQEAGAVRQIESLQRTVKAMQVRKDNGLISELQMMELQSGLDSAINGLDALRIGKNNLQMQIEQMLGEKITGTFEVGTLPRVTAEEINAIDVEKDLQQVLRRNPGVKAAEASEDQMLSMGIGSMSSAMWDSLSSANTYAIESAKLQAEAGFRSLYAQLLNKRDAVSVSRTALDVEQLSYDAAELKYNNGAISHDALLTAADELQTAKETVVTAENDLFAAYNQYNWAVKHGIVG